MRLTRSRDIFARAETRATCFDLYATIPHRGARHGTAHGTERGPRSRCLSFHWRHRRRPENRPLATVIYRAPVIHRTSTVAHVAGWSFGHEGGKFTGHVDARVRDRLVINEEIRRRRRSMIRTPLERKTETSDARARIWSATSDLDVFFL